MSGHLRKTILLLACVGALALAAPAQADPSWAEKRLAAKINDARDSRGLRQLRFATQAGRWLPLVGAPPGAA